MNKKSNGKIYRTLLILRKELVNIKTRYTVLFKKIFINHLKHFFFNVAI